MPFAIIQSFLNVIVEEAGSPTIRKFTGRYKGIIGRMGNRAWHVFGGTESRLNLNALC
jgi:hypothetical protein